MAGGVQEATERTAFTDNISALRSRRPDLADRLAGVAIPATATPAVARDGTATFRLVDQDGSPRWLGRTSTPAVRAAALVEGYGAESGNVLLPAMGSGMEVVALLDHLACHAAVFVHEPDVVALRLVLAVRDFSGALRAGRLVILSSADAAEALVGFFNDAPGYEFPQKLLILPDIDDSVITALRTSLEHASRRVGQMQLAYVAQRRAALGARARNRAGLNCIGISTIDPRSTAMEAVRSLADASRDSGLTAVANTPDAPDKCHTSALIGAIDNTAADGAVLVNCGWGPLAQHMPADFPAVSWLLPDTRLIAGMTDGFGNRHAVMASTAALRAAAIEAGARADRVAMLDVGFDATVFRPVDTPEADRFDVAFFGDIANLEPEPLGITLASQVCVWKHLRLEAADRLNAPADRVLKAAERASGVRLGDDHIRREFLRLTDGMIMPTMVKRALVQALLDAGFDVRIFGSGWQYSRVPAPVVRDAPSTPAARNEVYNAARACISPSCDHESARACLEVALTGGCSFFHAPHDLPPADHARRSDAVAVLPSFVTPREMCASVKRHLRGDVGMTEACRRAGDIVRQRHLLSHRFAEIRAALARLISTS